MAGPIVLEGEISTNGGTSWAPLFSRLDGRRYRVDLSPYANGATVLVRVRTRDLSDDAVSPYSASRSFVVSAPAPAPVAAIGALDRMRGITAGERTRMDGTALNVHRQLLVRDHDGAWRDLTALDGEDFVAALRWDDGLDAPVMSLSIELLREIERADGSRLSLAPYMTTSAPNLRTSNGTFAPLLRQGAGVRLFTAVTDPGVDPVAGDWVLDFDGYLDDPEAGGPLVRLTARDAGGRLQDTVIATPRTYGSDAGEPLADVLRRILADNGHADVTLAVVGSPNWFIRPYEQATGVTVLDALQTAALQIGWDVRYRPTGRATWQLVLYEPLRADVTALAADFTAGPSRYLDLSGFATVSDGIRNVVEVSYRDATTGEVATVRDEDPVSIAAHGRRPMVLAFDATSNIDTEAEALAVIALALADLADPYFAVALDRFYHWAPQLGAIVSLSPNGIHHDGTQKAAVVGLTKEITRDRRRITLRLRGRAQGAYRAWLRRETPRGAAVGPIEVRASSSVLSVEANGDANVRIEAVVYRGGVRTTEVGTVALTGIFDGAAIVAGPALNVEVQSGTVWRLSGAPPASFAFRGEFLGVVDENRDPMPTTDAGGAVVVPTLVWERFRTIPHPTDPALVRIDGLLTDPSGAATGAATVTLVRSGPVTTITPNTITGPLPLTVTADTARQASFAGESVIEAYGAAPGVEGEWERTVIQATEIDTLPVEISYVVDLRTATTERITITAKVGRGTTAPAISLSESLGTTATQFGSDTVTGTTRRRTYDMSRPADSAGIGAAKFLGTLAGFTEGALTVPVSEQLPASVNPPILPIPASIFTDWINDTTGRLTVSINDPDARYVAGSFQYRIQNTDGTWPAFLAMSSSATGALRTATVNVGVPAGKTSNVEWKYQYADVEGTTQTVGSVVPFTSRLTDPAYATAGGYYDAGQADNRFVRLDGVNGGALSGTQLSTSNTELRLEQRGDVFGATRLVLQHRNGANGAIFENAGQFDLVDFILKHPGGQRNIRFEGRVGSTILGSAQEFQFGTAGDAHLVSSDAGTQIRKGTFTSLGTATAPTFSLSGGTAANISHNAGITYGAVRIAGSKAGWSGIYFDDAARYLMVSANQQGFHDGTSWVWSFLNGVLGNGSVPMARVTAGVAPNGHFTLSGSAGRALTLRGGPQNVGTIQSRAPLVIDGSTAGENSSNPAVITFAVPGFWVGCLDLTSQGIFEFRNDNDAYASLKVGPFTATSINSTSIANTGAINTGSLLVGGNPVAGQVIAQTGPSGTAAEGTRWLQIS